MEYREVKRQQEQEEDNKEIIVTTASIRKIRDNNIEPNRRYTNSTDLEGDTDDEDDDDDILLPLE